ncbi:MAG: response regulator [Candidatus Hydrogenedentes bacterium]|nr:response regulator [Candidatus Hydrogenedentota bacterium]
MAASIQTAAYPVPDKETLAKASAIIKVRFASAFSCLVGYGIADAVGWMDLHMGLVLAVTAFEMLLNQPYPFLLRRFRHPERVFSTNVLVDAVAITVGTYVLGGSKAYIMLLVYPLPFIFSGIVLTSAHTYLSANAAFVCYAALAYLEHAHFIPPASNPDITMSGGLQIFFTLMVCPFFNTIAFAVTRLSGMIRAREEEVKAKNRQLEAEVDERMRTEEALIDAKEAAEAGARAKSEFLANMSHEIRTPMNGVIGIAELLLDTPLSQEQREYADTIIESANGLLAILNDILDFSKIEAGRLDIEIIDFDLRAILESASDVLCLRAQEKGLEYVYSLDPEVPSLVRGDPGRLRQILVNLIGNAVKFTSKGEIVVHAGLEDETNAAATVRFSVRDTGIGISPEASKSLFGAFMQEDTSTTRQYGGTGLGLAISKQLAELMGGQIGVASEPGMGSTFWFTAVLEKRSPEPEEPPRIGDVADALLGQPRILVVDDNATNRRMLEGQLRAWGCHPELAAGGEEALGALRAAVDRGEPFSLVLLDWQMPGMDGEQLGRLVRQDETLHEVRLVLMAPMTQRAEAARFVKLGFSAYLTKPVNQSDLRDCLATALRGPMPPREGKPGGSTRRTIAENRKHDLRILLAEDNATNRLVALKTLEKAGYRVDAVANGLEAVKALETTPYDIVLMDVQMPVMDGYEATRSIRKAGSSVLNPGVPVIAMTAHAMKGDREKCIEAGMDDYVPKPVKRRQLLAAIERCAGEGRPGPARASHERETSDSGEVCDRAALLERMDGDEALAQQVLDILIEQVPGQLDCIASAIARGDASAGREEAHALKGGCGSAGAMAMYRVAGEMERSCKQGDIESARALLLRLRAEFERFREQAT